MQKVYEDTKLLSCSCCIGSCCTGHFYFLSTIKILNLLSQYFLL